MAATLHVINVARLFVPVALGLSVVSLLGGQGCSAGVAPGLPDGGDLTSSSGGSTSTSASSSGSTSTSASSSGSSTGSTTSSSSSGKTSSSSSSSSGSSSGKTSSSSSGGSGLACPPEALQANSLDAFYKPSAPAAKGSCTAQEITALDNASKSPNAVTWDDVVSEWKASNPSSNCQSCLVGKASDTTWKTFVQEYAFDANNTGSFLNWAPCGTAAGGGVQSCGEIAHKFRYAYTVACDQCVDPAKFDECRTACYDDAGPCQVAADLWVGNCPPASVNTALNQCNTIKAVATVTCGP
jgi:hypothetical protein